MSPMVEKRKVRKPLKHELHLEQLRRLSLEASDAVEPITGSEIERMKFLRRRRLLVVVSEVTRSFCLTQTSPESDASTLCDLLRWSVSAPKITHGR